MDRPRSLLATTLLAAGLAVAITFAMRMGVSDAVAGSLGIGAGVGVATYVHRRWLRPLPRPAREAALYGAATAAGWAGAQLILDLL